jgi:hypothetical protein
VLGLVATAGQPASQGRRQLSVDQEAQSRQALRNTG